MEYSFILAADIFTQSDGELKVAILAFVASIIAIVVSVISLLQNKALNNTNLQAKYFEKIFTEYFVNKIPNAVDEIKFENGKLSNNYKKLNDTMMNMINDSKYFAYAKHSFYIELKNKTIKLEDKLIEGAAKNWIDRDEQLKFIFEIHEDVMEIVKFINKNYHNF